MASASETKTDEKTFQFKWIIPNWKLVQPKVDEVLKQKFTFETLLFSSIILNWEIGFYKTEKQFANVLFYQKLVKLPGTLKDLDTAIKISLLNSLGAVVTNPVGEFNFKEKCVHTFNTDFFLPGDWSTYIDSTGCIKFSINFTVRFSSDLPKTKASTLIVEEFNNVSTSRMSKNWVTVLGNMDDSDLKIKTNDDQEILAHKLVLKVQCPAFLSQFSGNATSTINTPEISGKTMRVLLHLFYSGELLDTWCDEDIIVEFISAVAKYKMQEVAEMLDKYLGNWEEKGIWENDWQLLKLAQKMSLKQAEQRLNERILSSVKSVQKADELLALFSSVKITDVEREGHDLLVRIN